MRTLLSQFCEEFDASVRPLLDPLKRATETLSEHAERGPARELLPALQDVAHQFQVLADKVAGQQAYVLIFGPLKSGKSTLMNAMSAAYVSEVTALPAYPCMVYVSDATTREFVVTRYDGEQRIFHDTAALRMQVARAHTELADQIRRVEAEGHEFDPGLHFPQAIRRIDVHVPAGDLAQSGSVLVDTPGLYSRMKFGYDRMTREFRNAAACAIFVVKTDNLFLEQVFEEFQSLLGLFSRIFLVVNLDGNKRDLRPDGTLVPSLESEDPIRVVEAFENLAMNASLKTALDEGRLRIYPVDLLRAASRRLGGRAAEDESTGEGVGRHGQADFDGFMTDLTEYLNSTDYLIAFLGDSLRCAQSLLSETEGTCQHDAVRAMNLRMDELESTRGRVQAKLEALGRLSSFDWHDALSGLREDLVRVAQAESDALSKKNAHEIATALDRWFQTDASFQALLDTSILPLFTSSQRALAQSVHAALGKHVAENASAVRLPQGLAKDLVTAELSLTEFGRKGLEHVDPVAGVRSEAAPLSIDEIPVNRGFWDWVLFRSQARVRRRLFGPADRPALRIPREQKSRRLGAAARQVMERKLSEYQESHVPALLDRLALRIFEDYAQALTESIQERIAAGRAALSGELSNVQVELKEHLVMLNRLAELGVAVASAQQSVQELSARYRETDPDLLTRPVDELELDEAVSDYELEPQPRPAVAPRVDAPSEATREV